MLIRGFDPTQTPTKDQAWKEFRTSTLSFNRNISKPQKKTENYEILRHRAKTFVFSILSTVKNMEIPLFIILILWKIYYTARLNSLLSLFPTLKFYWH